MTHYSLSHRKVLAANLAGQARFRRRGSVYITVLGAAMIVSLTATFALHRVRLQSRSTRQLEDLHEARLLAFSAVEFAMARVSLNSNWRSDYQSGTAYPINAQQWLNEEFSKGTMSFRFMDADGDLDDDASQPIEVQGEGRVGQAVWVYSATILPDDTLTPGNWKRTFVMPALSPMASSGS